jgi:hypothetical protein
VKDFLSVILYSNQTRSMTQTDQRFPNVSSQTKGLLINPDGSVDVYFGPTAPAGKEKNWVQTIPGKGWNTILRLYGPLEPWFNQTWRPGRSNFSLDLMVQTFFCDYLTKAARFESANRARVMGTRSVSC